MPRKYKDTLSALMVNIILPWMYLTPFCCYRVYFLPVIKKQKGDTPDVFSDRVRNIIKTHLNLKDPPPDYEKRLADYLKSMRG